jgi:hypothetical protein
VQFIKLIKEEGEMRHELMQGPPNLGKNKEEKKKIVILPQPDPGCGGDRLAMDVAADSAGTGLAEQSGAPDVDYNFGDGE